MIGFAEFHTVDIIDVPALITIAASGRTVYDIRHELEPQSTHWRGLVAVIIESRHSTDGDMLVAVVAYCSKKEAKRLTYPETNRNRGLQQMVMTPEGPAEEPVLFFADDMISAMAFANKEVRAIKSRNSTNGRSNISQVKEYERIRAYLVKKKDWPALILMARSHNDGLFYFLVVDKTMARKLVYKDKEPGIARGKLVMTGLPGPGAAIGGTITGRITRNRTVHDNSARRSIIRDAEAGPSGSWGELTYNSNLNGNPTGDDPVEEQPSENLVIGTEAGTHTSTGSNSGPFGQPAEEAEEEHPLTSEEVEDLAAHPLEQGEEDITLSEWRKRRKLRQQLEAYEGVEEVAVDPQPFEQGEEESRAASGSRRYHMTQQWGRYPSPIPREPVEEPDTRFTAAFREGIRAHRKIEQSAAENTEEETVEPSDELIGWDSYSDWNWPDEGEEES